MKFTLCCATLLIACACSKSTPGEVHAKAPASTTTTTPVPPTPAVPRPTTTPTPRPPDTTIPRPSDTIPNPPKPPVTSTEKPSSELDADLTRRVREALMDDTTLPAAAKNVIVAATNGTVVLTGEVATPEEKIRVESIVTAVTGVRTVDNRLVVVP